VVVVSGDTVVDIAVSPFDQYIGEYMYTGTSTIEYKENVFGKSFQDAIPFNM
jgi:hypothetical protein